MQSIKVERAAGRVSILALLVFIFLFSVFPLRSPDAWTHLSVGRYIYETRSIPETEVFVLPRLGEPETYPEWLFGLVMFGLYSAGGVNAMILFKALVVALCFYFAWLDARGRGANIYIFIPLALLSAAAARSRFLERPEVMSYLFVAIYIYLLDLHESKQIRGFFAIPPLQALWSNMHPASVIGLFIVGAYLVADSAGDLMKGRMAKGRKTIYIAIVFAFSLLATLATPYPLEPFRAVLSLRGADKIRPFITELVPVFSSPVLFKYFLMLCLLWVVSAVARLAVKDPPDIAGLLLFMGAASLPVFAMRGMGVFAITALVLTAGNLGRAWPALGRARLPLAAIITLPLAVAIAIDRPPPGVKLGLGEAEGRFPGGTVRFIKENGVSGNLFNTFEDGGYLNFHLAPRYRAFIDGRLTPKEDMLKNTFRYAEVIYALPHWRETLEAQGVDIIAARCCFSGSALMAPLVERLADEPGWALVYAERDGFVFLRENPQNAPLIEKNHIDKEEIFLSTIKWAPVLSDGTGYFLPLTLGKAYLRLGMMDEARANLGAWLQKAPEDDATRAFLEELEDPGR